LARNDAQA
jgi:hypothetical protein